MMKRSILAPLCSALVIPGLGQIINHNLKKGLLILSIVFFLLVACAIKLVLIATFLFNQLGSTHGTVVSIMGGLQRADLSSLIYLLIAFAIVWFYSVMDAFRTGKKLESQAKDEILLN